MISIGFLLSLAAITIAVIKRGERWKLVLGLAGLSVVILLLTAWYALSCSGDFCGIGQSVIGSAAGVIFAVAAVVVAYSRKPSSYK